MRNNRTGLQAKEQMIRIEEKHEHKVESPKKVTKSKIKMNEITTTKKKESKFEVQKIPVKKEENEQKPQRKDNYGTVISKKNKRKVHIVFRDNLKEALGQKSNDASHDISVNIKNETNDNSINEILNLNDVTRRTKSVHFGKESQKFKLVDVVKIESFKSYNYVENAGDLTDHYIKDSTVCACKCSIF